MAGINLTSKELAQRWRMTLGHICNLRGRKKGCPYLKIGNKILYPLEEVEKFEAKRKMPEGEMWR